MSALTRSARPGLATNVDHGYLQAFAAAGAAGRLADSPSGSQYQLADCIDNGLEDGNPPATCRLQIAGGVARLDPFT
jgi:hypothetical protein